MDSLPPRIDGSFRTGAFRCRFGRIELAARKASLFQRSTRRGGIASDRARSRPPPPSRTPAPSPCLPRSRAPISPPPVRLLFLARGRRDPDSAAGRSRIRGPGSAGWESVLRRRSARGPRLRRPAAANAAVSGERAAEEARAAAAVMEGLDVARGEEAKAQEQAGMAAEAEMEALRIPPGGAELVFPA